MNALATGQQGETLEAEVSHQVAYPSGGLPNFGELEAFVGIEVEDHAVRPFDVVRPAAPAVEFDDTGAVHRRIGLHGSLVA